MNEQPIALIGAGDVVCKRYVGGLAAHGGPIRLRLERVFGLEESCSLDVEYQRVGPVISRAALTISEAVPASWPIVIATPTASHVPYALALADRRLVIEKPLAIQLRDWDAVMSGLAPRFPLAYYLLEKALPLLPLVRAPFRRGPYLERLHPRMSPERLDGIRSDLGTLRKITGCIFEGRGDAATLERRPWVLESGGGNTFDTFFHLASLFTALSDGRASELASFPRRAARHGAGSADTATLVTGRVEEAELTLASAKYISAEEHQRWISMNFDGGRVRVDLESCRLEGECTHHGAFAWALADPSPYATQFSLVSHWLAEPSLPLPLDIYRRALELSARIRPAPATTIQSYEAGASPSALWPHWRRVC